MRGLFLFCLVLCSAFMVDLATSLRKNKTEMNLTEALLNEQVIPDVIDASPEVILKVNYPFRAKVHLGNELTPFRTRDMPRFNYDAERNELYCIAIVDPDAPSRENPTFREVLHMLVANIPGKIVRRGQTLAEYIGPAPPKDTGLHRYIALLYRQTGGRIITDMYIPNTTVNGRTQFSIRSFAQQNNLTLEAANFFQAQYDVYVPIAEAQTSG